MTGTHALVAPSGLHLTMACAASLLLQMMAPEPPPSDETLEGDAWHWHAAQWAQGNRLDIGAVFKSGGQEWTVDTDMVTGSKLWAYHTVNHSTARFEDPVSMPQIHEQCHGTPDWWQSRCTVVELVTPDFITVKDYKSGHRVVEAFENWQLIAYALGVCNRLGITNPDTKILLAIIQPKHYGNQVKEWTTTLGQLMVYVGRIAARVAEALAPNAQATVGKHCIDCKARHLCKTLQHASAHVVEFVGIAEAQELSHEALGSEARILLQAMNILKARYEGLTTQIDALMRSGTSIPFWMLDNGRSLLKWNEGVSVEDIRLLGQAANVNTIQPVKPITPTQAKDAGVDESIIALYATRQPSGKTLKPDTNMKARRVFGANKV